jgi:long-chain acyl-CoA synthetase
VREFSLPALAEIPATANLAGTVFRRAAEQPQAVVLRRPGAAGLSGDWTDVTASQFKDDVVALAKGLVAAGIEVGDRVALMSHTRYEWTLIDYAIWTAGAVTVPVYETSSAEQTEWILSDSGATACFAETAAFEDMIGGLRDRLAGLSQVWRIDPGSAPCARRARTSATRSSRSARPRPRRPTWPRSSIPPAPPGVPRAAS